MCDSVISINDNNFEENTIYNIERELLQNEDPNVWNVHTDGNIDKQIEIDFRMYALTVVDYLNLDLENISVFEFYSSVKYLKNKFKKKK